MCVCCMFSPPGWLWYVGSDVTEAHNFLELVHYGSIAFLVPFLVSILSIATATEFHCLSQGETSLERTLFCAVCVVHSFLLESGYNNENVYQMENVS